MRLLFRLPLVKPDAFQELPFCPYPGCGGRHFRRVQEVPKPLRDTQYQEVKAQRYRCLRCGRTFRVYPTGVSRDHFSQRVKGLAVALYLLGLSSRAVSLLLEALGLLMSKTLVYYTVQEAARKVPGMRRERVMEGVRVPALGSDGTSVKVSKGEMVSHWSCGRCGQRVRGMCGGIGRGGCADLEGVAATGGGGGGGRAAGHG